jgi:thymidylate synthase (FAD)|tara:strand:- start:91 stop:762 length:672 start_codon:yes stop_codon:yes gene_type:complete
MPNNFVHWTERFSLVKLVDYMGSDLTVVNAARVSFGKQKIEFEDDDEKLINYLAKHNHWSPFGHCSVQFHIKAPVFVARQLVKHQIGLTWNEISRRYVDSEPEFFEPDVWRGAADNKKQGSSDESIDINPKGDMVNDYQHALNRAKWTYEELLRKGVCPEQARMVLPQSMITEWYWSGTLYAFARVCNLRCKPDAQQETREIANMIDKECGKLFPISWSALID